jgi:hypothetical protein
MKTKLLLASLAMTTCAVSAWAELPDGTELVTVADGNYYLYNESSGQFLGRGAGWGTQAILDNYGVPFSLTTTEGSSVFKFLDSANTLGNAGGTPYTDNAANSMALVKSNNGFQIYNNSASKYISFTNGNSVFVDADGTEWVIKTIEERNEIVAANRLAQINANLKAAGVEEVTSESGIADALKNADMASIEVTDKVSNADFTNGVTGWTWTAGRGGSNTATGSNAVEVYQGTGTLSQSITVDNPGLYKVVFQAFQRVGWNANCVSVGNLGVILGNSYFSANDSYAVIPDWYTDRGGDANPNSMGDARTLFDAGKYTNDLYVYVGEDKSINLSYNIQSYTDGAWAIMDNVKLYYITANLTSFKEAYEAALASAKAIDQTKDMNSEVLASLQAAIEKYSSVEESKSALVEATTALNSIAAEAEANISAYESFVDAYEAMEDVVKTTNLYSESGLQTYREPYDNAWAAYEAGTLTTAEANATVNPHAISGWHSANTVDDLLLELWGQENYDGQLYINTWSTEGTTDGTNFLVPFFEYWTGDAGVLSAKTWTATVEGLDANKVYDVEVWARVRYSNGQTVAPYGLYLQVGNSKDSIDICAGDTITRSQFYIGKFTASGMPDSNGTLKINIIIAKDNNVSWLSFKDVVYSASEILTGVEALDAKSEEAPLSIYDLSGRKLNALKKGINIVNGKKVLVK